MWSSVEVPGELAKALVIALDGLGNQDWGCDKRKNIQGQVIIATVTNDDDHERIW